MAAAEAEGAAKIGGGPPCGRVNTSDACGDEVECGGEQHVKAFKAAMAMEGHRGGGPWRVEDLFLRIYSGVEPVEAQWRSVSGDPEIQRSRSEA